MRTSSFQKRAGLLRWPGFDRFRIAHVYGTADLSKKSEVDTEASRGLYASADRLAVVPQGITMPIGWYFDFYAIRLLSGMYSAYGRKVFCRLQNTSNFLLTWFPIYGIIRNVIDCLCVLRWNAETGPWPVTGEDTRIAYVVKVVRFSWLWGALRGILCPSAEFWVQVCWCFAREWR